MYPRTSKVFSTALYLPYLRGQAYLRLGQNAEAAAEFRKILDHPGWNGYFSPVYPLAHLGTARAHNAAGDVDSSRKAYQDFFAIWKNADADLPVTVQARKEYSQLH